MSLFSFYFFLNFEYKITKILRSSENHSKIFRHSELDRKLSKITIHKFVQKSKKNLEDILFNSLFSLRY